MVSSSLSKLHNVFILIKGINSGYSSSNNKQMLVENDGEVFLLSIEKVGDGKVEDFMETLRNSNGK